MQCFCFFWTKAHFSSSWASWVAGGKSHEFVVGLPGVGASLEGVAADGVLIDTNETGGLPDAAAVLEVLEDGQGSVAGESGAEEGGALAFGEARLAGTAGEQAAAILAVAEGDAEVAVAAQTVVGAVGVLTAEGVQVVHEEYTQEKVSGQWTASPRIVECLRLLDNAKGTRPRKGDKKP